MGATPDKLEQDARAEATRRAAFSRLAHFGDHAIHGLVSPSVALLIRDAIRYGLCSLAALALDVGLLLILSTQGLHHLVASAISFSAGMALTYVLSVALIYKTRRKTHASIEMAGFLVTGLIGLLLTQVLLWLFVDRLGLNVALAKAPTVACVFAFNFLSRRALLFSSNTRTAQS
jgi:putative flippase GtrA